MGCVFVGAPRGGAGLAIDGRVNMEYGYYGRKLFILGSFCVSIGINRIGGSLVWRERLALVIRVMRS